MQGLFDREGRDLREGIMKSEREISESCSVERSRSWIKTGGKTTLSKDLLCVL